MGNCNCIKTKSTTGIDEINENLSPDQMLSIDYNDFKEEIMKRNLICEPINEELLHLCYKTKKDKITESSYSNHSMQEIIF
jgi:hypothetical protein